MSTRHKRHSLASIILALSITAPAQELASRLLPEEPPRDTTLTRTLSTGFKFAYHMEGRNAGQISGEMATLGLAYAGSRIFLSYLDDFQALQDDMPRIGFARNISFNFLTQRFDFYGLQGRYLGDHVDLYRGNLTFEMGDDYTGLRYDLHHRPHH